MSISHTSEVSIRYDISPAATSAGVTFFLLNLIEANYLTPDIFYLAIDPMKVRRTREEIMERVIMCEEKLIDEEHIRGLFIDCRKNSTLVLEQNPLTNKFHMRTIKKERITVTCEPDGRYLTHYTPPKATPPSKPAKEAACALYNWMVPRAIHESVEIMKPSKSGATKRKEAAATKDAISKLPKVTSFFTPIPSNCTSNEKNCSNEVVIHEQLDIANNQPNTIETLYTLPLPPFSSVACDPASRPEQIFDGQRCDLVKRGPQQVDIDFPCNIAAKRPISTVHYKRVMNNGETVPRLWIVYLVKSDKIFCFCCKLFETNESPFRSGTSTWEGLSKKLKDHETGTSHQKCFRQWMQLKEGINNDSSIDKQEMQLFLKERQFWRDVLERLIDIIKFLSERKLAFRGSEEVLSSTHNGNFLGLFELIAKIGPVLNELQKRIEKKQTHDHYLSNKIQNEFIQLIVKEVEKQNLKKLMISKYYAIILDCTPDVSNQEQLTVILRFVECDTGNEVTIKEAFFGYLQVSDSSGKGFFDTFLEREKELKLNTLDCRGQSYDNGSNIKGKNSGVQSRILQTNPKALYAPCANHCLNLVVVDSAKSSTRTLSFFGVLSRLYTIFSSSTQCWSNLKEHVEIAVKNQSDTRWESRINCIKPLRYYFGNVLIALEKLEVYAIEKKNGKTATEARSLITYISDWAFLLSIVIYAETTAREIAEKLNIPRNFPSIRNNRKKKLVDYEGDDEGGSQTPQSQFKNDFFFVLVDQALQSVRERFQQTHDVTAVFSFLFNQKSLFQAYKDNTFLLKCQNFHNKMGDIDPFEMEMELKQFIHLVLENDEKLKTAIHFLNYINSKCLQEVYPNVAIALRVLLTCPVTAATA
ncbi:uncharacterized protein LOC101239909 [Hydra vulgaris]|uniref:uncharacterized protein LOC101239909 n=1 Tax=Hydra vulgaris TaxID=6087 RepID=UPI001F5E37AF|nr:uncharacterized protein LOC101239909 [Hydra vulgaris]